MRDNERGFHGPSRQGHDHNKGGATGGEGRGTGGKGAAKEPTNHAGHTHEMARRHEHDARVEAVRNAHGAGRTEHDYHGGHERIAHDTHKLHQHGDNGPSQSKYGAGHHFREGAKE